MQVTKKKKKKVKKQCQNSHQQVSNKTIIKQFPLINECSKPVAELKNTQCKANNRSFLFFFFFDNLIQTQPTKHRRNIRVQKCQVHIVKKKKLVARSALSGGHKKKHKSANIDAHQTTKTNPFINHSFQLNYPKTKSTTIESSHEVQHLETKKKESMMRSEGLHLNRGDGGGGSFFLVWQYEE